MQRRRTITLYLTRLQYYNYCTIQYTYGTNTILLPLLPLSTTNITSHTVTTATAVVVCVCVLALAWYHNRWHRSRSGFPINFREDASAAVAVATRVTKSVNSSRERNLYKKKKNRNAAARPVRRVDRRVGETSRRPTTAVAGRTWPRTAAATSCWTWCERVSRARHGKNGKRHYSVYISGSALTSLPSQKSLETSPKTNTYKK